MGKGVLVKGYFQAACIAGNFAALSGTLPQVNQRGGKSLIRLPRYRCRSRGVKSAPKAASIFARAMRRPLTSKRTLHTSDRGRNRVIAERATQLPYRLRFPATHTNNACFLLATAPSA